MNQVPLAFLEHLANSSENPDDGFSDATAGQRAASVHPPQPGQCLAQPFPEAH
jgi:hypothetical protein